MTRHKYKQCIRWIILQTQNLMLTSYSHGLTHILSVDKNMIVYRILKQQYPILIETNYTPTICPTYSLASSHGPTTQFGWIVAIHVWAGCCVTRVYSKVICCDHYCHISVPSTHCALVTVYGITDLSQHCLTHWPLGDFNDILDE